MIKYLLITLLILPLGRTVQAQAQQVSIPDSLLRLDQDPNFTTFTPEAFHNCWGSYPNAQLVDVRTPEEYSQGHIAHALNINVKDGRFLQTADSLLDRSRPVAVYCKGGIRSRQAAQLLLERGFMIYNLQGGYDSYKASGF